MNRRDAILPIFAQSNILIVDDTPDNLRLLSQTLTKQGYKVRCALSGSMALMSINAELPDLIILDINMPHMNGFEVCEQLKNNQSTQDIPIIFISAYNEVVDKVKAFELGAVDYISKPFQIPEVLARVYSQLNLLYLQKQLLEKNQLLELEISNRVAAETEVRQLNLNLEQIIASRTAQLQTEISNRQQVQEQLEYTISHESSIGLPNQIWMSKKIEQELEQLQQNSGYKFAVFFVNCDRFQIFNDSGGQLIGDSVLIKLATYLQQVIPDNASLSSCGGDEFIILLTNIPHRDGAIELAASLLQQPRISLTIEQQISLNLSIGIFIVDSPLSTTEGILRAANIAMYQAKKAGINQYQIGN